MAIPQGFRNVLGIATPVCGLVRNDRGVSKQTDKLEFEREKEVNHYGLIRIRTLDKVLR